MTSVSGRWRAGQAIDAELVRGPLQDQHPDLADQPIPSGPVGGTTRGGPLAGHTDGFARGLALAADLGLVADPAPETLSGRGWTPAGGARARR